MASSHHEREPLDRIDAVYYLGMLLLAILMAWQPQ